MKKEIQVVYIITKLELGGAQKVCLSLLEELQKAGQITILISGNEGVLVNDIKHNKNIYLFDHFKREISLATLYSELKIFFTLITTLKQLKKQYAHLIVHTHSTKAGLIGRWAAFFAGIKNRIHTVHGFGFHPYQNKIGWIINYILELLTNVITTHYVCVSSYDVKTGIALLPSFAHKHSIIRAAVTFEYLPAYQLTSFPPDDEPFIFGTVACFKKQKNIVDLLKAFTKAHQHNPHIQLQIIGDGHLRPLIESYIDEHALTDVVTLLGWQKNVVPLMSTWHAFVLSSLWEGLPCAIVEARLLKLPIISYKTGGIADVISDGENGWLCHPGNWQRLAQLMLDISKNKPVYERFKYCNEDLSSFHTTTMIKDHIQLYRSLLK